MRSFFLDRTVSNFYRKFMEAKGYILLALAFIFSLEVFAQGYISRVGKGNAAITPRGFSVRSVSRVHTSDSFYLENVNRAIPLEKAKQILQNTNIITSPKIGEGGAVSEQTLAFASVLHYKNKSTAKLSARMVYNFAKTDEARVYGLMLLYCVCGKNEYDTALSDVNLNKEVNTLFGGTYRRLKISEFFDAFFREPSLFVPKSEILEIQTERKEIRNGNPIINVSPPPIIINGNARGKAGYPPPPRKFPTRVPPMD